MKAALSAVLALIALVLIFAKSTEAWISHDEDQFLAPGLLTARDGLVPYRDYPLFHVPNLVILNGWLAMVSPSKILGFRGLSVLAAWGTLLLVAWQTKRWLEQSNSLHRAIPLAAAIAAGALILFSPMFSSTVRFAWNHQVPTFCWVSAVLALCTAVGQPRWAVPLATAAGFLVGMAAGMRLTFLPLLAPLGLGAIFLPGMEWRRRAWCGAAFTLGALVALSPCIYLLIAYPEQFVFSNFTYPKLALLWRKYPLWKEDLAKFVDPTLGLLDLAKARMEGRPLSRKLGDFAVETLRPNGVAFALFFIFGLPGCFFALRKNRETAYVAGLLLVTLPFIFWGALAPSRYHPQYWYALLPLLVLITALGMASLYRIMRPHRWLLAGLAVLGLAAVQVREYQALLAFGRKDWMPRRLESVSRSLRKAVGENGRVLTLEPLMALEAGLGIYPELSSGEFGWRSSHLLPREKRQRLRLMSAYDLEDITAERPAAAILLENGDEKLHEPFERYAAAHGFTRRTIIGPYTLLRLEKQVAPDDAIPSAE